MKNFLKNHKKLFITIVVALCFTMMAAAGLNAINPRFFGNLLGTVMIPVESSLEWLRQRSGGLGEYFATLRNLTEEVEHLRAENAELRGEHNKLIMVEKHNEVLLEILNMAEEYNQYETMGAEIVGKDPGNWFNAYTVNKGARDGVEVNMWVTYDYALAGRVTEVYDTYSKIVSLIDDTSRIAARTIRRNDFSSKGGTGFVLGDTILMMQGLCKMERIPEDADIEVGDLVVTGHLSTIYPPNIPIGEITEITREPDGTQKAIVKPLVDFSDMRAVVIVTELADSEFARDGD